MAKTLFNDSWYVQKNRIQVFIPFKSNYSFEIDKTGSGSIGFIGSSGDQTKRFQSTFGVDSDDKPIPMTLVGREVNGLIFRKKTESSDVLSLDNAVSRLFTSAMYGSGRSTTINFWTYPESVTDNDDSFGVVDNTVLAESYASGYAFGVAAHTSTIDLSNANLQSNIKSHRMNLYAMDRKENKYHSELVDRGTGAAAGVIDFQTWIMNTIIINHEDSMNMTATFHVRYYDDGGNYNHYWTTFEHMNSDDYPNIIDRQNKTNITWYIGASASNDGTLGRMFTGALRNPMIYNVALGSDEMDAIFNNHIDPYEASSISFTDIDSFDPNFWGKYGILASNSNIKIEKSIIGETTRINTKIPSGAPLPTLSSMANPTQHLRRFDIACRDKSRCQIISPDLYEGSNVIPAVKNSTKSVFDVSNLDKVDSVAVAAWRNSFISGNGKIRMFASKALSGSFIEGSSDATRIDATTRPDDLPGGRYITYWLNSSNQLTIDANGNNTNYPAFLPQSYLRDRLGKTYKGFNSGTSFGIAGGIVDPASDEDGKYINGMFWNNTARFESVSWTSPGQTAKKTNDEVQAMTENDRIDFCENWKPVYWAGAIYEVTNEPTLSGTGFFGMIRLTLFTLDFTKTAVYTKMRNPNYTPASGSQNPNEWQFESFNDNNTKKESERLARIYLPHINIPVVKVPLFEPEMTVEVWDSEKQNSNEDAAMVGSSIVLFSNTYASPAISYSKLSMRGKISQPPYVNHDGVAGGLPNPYYFQPIDSGWYEFQYYHSAHIGDRCAIITLTVVVTGGDVIAPLKYEAHDKISDWVGGSSHGGATASTTVKILVYMASNQTAKISRTAVVYGDTDGDAETITRHKITRSSAGYGHIPGGQMVTAVKMKNISDTDADRYSRYVTTTEEGSGENLKTRRWINVRNVEGKYTRSLRQGTDPFEYEAPLGN